ncbi:MAG: hypothetical protein AAGF94_02215 [Pseudomonadota bacterium]
MPTAKVTELCDLAMRLARRHYEHLRRHEGDPLDVPWRDLPDPQKQLWTASMTDLLHGLTPAERQRLSEVQSDDLTAGTT